MKKIVILLIGVLALCGTSYAADNVGFTVDLSGDSYVGLSFSGLNMGSWGWHVSGIGSTDDEGNSVLGGVTRHFSDNLFGIAGYGFHDPANDPYVKSTYKLGLIYVFGDVKKAPKNGNLYTTVGYERFGKMYIGIGGSI